MTKFILNLLYRNKYPNQKVKDVSFLTLIYDFDPTIGGGVSCKSDFIRNLVLNMDLHIEF